MSSPVSIPSPGPRSVTISTSPKEDQGSLVVGRLLGKRVKMHHSKSTASLSDVSTVSSGAVTPKVKPNASVMDCVELCRLLLQKVGADENLNDTAELDRLLTTEYPPGVADLLGRITGALDTDGLLDSVSDISDSSDDEISPNVPLPPTAPQSLGDDTAIDCVPTHVPIAGTASVLKREPAAQGTAYKAETEIAISRIFNLGKVSAVQDPSIAASAPYDGPGVVTMTGFGELGRFGNQVLQYAFLKAYASLHNIPEIQVPSWIGAKLFGLDDAPVSRALPPVVEYHGTLANSTFTDELITYVKKSNVDGETAELEPSLLDESFAGKAPRNVDIWGWFQWHSSVYVPFKPLLRKTFAPDPLLAAHLGKVFEREVRYRGGRKRTVVGVHLRYGDYQNIAASSFGYCAPTSWYLEWLRAVWPALNDPILIVTSDDLKAVLGDFAEFKPVTTNSVGMGMPNEFKGLKAGFFPDWYALTQCDVLAISNSTFSFSASLMNERVGLRVFRAHYAQRMVEIVPWDAEPIVHRDLNKNGISHAVETLRILYNTQGTGAVVRNILYELPYYGLRSLVMKAVLWRGARERANIAASSGAITAAPAVRVN